MLLVSKVISHLFNNVKLIFDIFQKDILDLYHRTVETTHRVPLFSESLNKANNKNPLMTHGHVSHINVFSGKVHLSSWNSLSDSHMDLSHNKNPARPDLTNCIPGDLFPHWAKKVCILLFLTTVTNTCGGVARSSHPEQPSN